MGRVAIIPLALPEENADGTYTKKDDGYEIRIGTGNGSSERIYKGTRKACLWKMRIFDPYNPEWRKTDAIHTL